MKPLQDTVDYLSRLADKPRWVCSRCKETFIGRASSTSMCNPCEDKYKEELWRNLPKHEALRRSQVPADKRVNLPWLAEPWPRDARSGFNSIDPLTWADRMAKYREPFLLTLVGGNGAGKSTRAAHLLYLAHRAGFCQLLWTTELALVRERQGFPPYQHLDRSLAAGALVIDELGSTRGKQTDVEIAWQLTHELIDARCRRPTIFTTHRALSKAGAKQRGQPEGGSIEAQAPAVYDRLKDGLIINLGHRSFRGRRALGLTDT